MMKTKRLRSVASPLLSAFAPVALASALVLACDAQASGDDDQTGGTTSSNSGGKSSSGGSTGSGGTSSGSGGSTSPAGFGNPAQAGMGSSSDRWAKAGVTRDGVSYFFMANGWGPGFQSQSVEFTGTAFTVTSMQGKQGSNYEPASYPTVFCGAYSDSKSGECGLPNTLAAIQTLRTGWRWKPNGNTGQYNAAYDIWLSNTNATSGLSAYLMVWLRDPPGQQPAGRLQTSNVTVSGAPSTWNLWVGNVGNVPYVAYVRPEGSDLLEAEFDVMDFVRDVRMRNISLPGSQIVSVAVGFEIWNGPITNLVSEDFYVDVN
ncbi:MAG: GH12 family glycosyl hydrolase domain-containing protein [Myxococcota bacterium]